MKYRLLVLLFAMALVCELLLTSRDLVYCQDPSPITNMLSKPFVRYANNPILVPSLSWEGINIGDPIIIEEATELRMYYSGFGGVNAIGYATSPKTYPPTSWTKRGTVFAKNPIPGQWDSSYVRLGNVLKVDSTYYLYYAATGGPTSIGLATSSDGITFTRSGSNPILVPSGNELAIGDPTVIRVDATHWYMYYDDRTTSATLPEYKVATSSNGISWTKVGVILNKGASGQWDDTYLEHPQIYYAYGYYILIYEGYGGSGNEPWAHGLAYSTDPTAMFTKYSANPFFQKSGIDGTFDVYHIATPTFFLHNEVWYLFYQGGDNKDNYISSNWKFGVAWTSDTPPPNTGTLRLFASYNGSYVSTLVTVTGPQNVAGTTTVDQNNPLKFSLTVGAYTVSGTYFTSKSETVTVVKDQIVDVTLNFGGSPPPPPPELPLHLIFIISAVASVVGLVFFARRKSGLHFSSRRRVKHKWRLS